jgi:hypothetical protein
MCNEIRGGMLTKVETGLSKRCKYGYVRKD